MSFSFNKETRRSLRERIRDGINLIPGASTVVQAPSNIIDAVVHHQQGQGGGGGGGGTAAGSSTTSATTRGQLHSSSTSSSSSSPVHNTTNTSSNKPNVKSHSVDSPMMIDEEEPTTNSTTSIIKPTTQQQPPPASPSYLTADNNTTTDEYNRSGSRSGSVSSCSSSTSSSPSKYRTYVVKDNDTVTSIAASFDCTPSELMRVNRLITARVLFPGQVLKIPNKAKLQPTNTTNQPTTTQQQPTTLEQQQKAVVDPATATILESITYAQRKFLKIKVRHVTDGNGVVTGTLLITPNAVMFDPNVSDPLVIEQGAETYGIIVPIEYIVGASIWSDICGMRVRGKEAFVPPGPRPVLWGSSGSGSGSGSGGGGGSESAAGGDGEGEEQNNDDEQRAENNRLEEVTDHPLKEGVQQDVTTWYFCLTIGRPASVKDEGGNSGGGGGEVNRRARRRNPFCVTYGQKNCVRPEFWFSVGREQVPELYKYWMFWWPNIYGDVDIKLITERGYELVDWDNLDVTDDQGNKSSTGGTASSKAARNSSNGGGTDEEQSMAQELNELTKESWEMLKQPYAKLSSFITTRGSSIMKSSSHSSQSSVSECIHSHTTATPPHHHAPGGGQQQQQSSSSSTGLFNSHHFSITNPMNSFFFESFSNISPNHSVFDDTDDDDDEFGSFEQVVTNEELRNLLAMGGEEMMAINLPDLIGGKSDILEEEDMRNITRHLTARAEGYPWTLIFTSSRDGFSLNSLYRRNSLMQEDSPVMLIIQDTSSRVFGALVSCSLHTSDSFYGTGQSFLFTLRPEFNVYKWTGENLFFVKGNHDGIWIGAGDGKFGLYVDGDLNCGRTETCQTYGNPPLTEPQDFIIKTLECWAFGNYVLGTGNNDLIGGVTAQDK